MTAWTCWAGSYRDCDYIVHNHNESNRIGDEMDSVTLFECERSWVHPRSSQTENFKISICCLSSKHVALRIKSKDLLAWYQDNVSEWSYMSTSGFNEVQLCVLI